LIGLSNSEYHKYAINTLKKRLNEAMDIHEKMLDIKFPCQAFLYEKAKLVQRIIEIQRSILKLEENDSNN